MAEDEAQQPITVGGVTLTVCEGVVKAMTSRSESATTGQAKAVSRRSLVPFSDNVVTETKSSPTTVTKTIRDFWVVSSSGLEKHVETSAPVDVRDGHTVQLFLYGEAPAAMLNVDIGRWWALPEAQDALMFKFGSHGDVSWGFLFGSILLTLFLLAFAADGVFPIVFGLLGAGILYLGPARFFLNRRARGAYRRFLNGVGAKLN